MLTNRAAVELVIAALEEQGRLEPIDAGLLNAVRSAAALVDDLPTPAALKEYSNLLDRLRNIGSEDDNDFALLLDELRAADRDPQ